MLFEKAEEKNKKDKGGDNKGSIKERNAIFALDSESQELLKGSTVDYITDGFAQYFKLNNPNSGSNCGCGSSFDLKEED